MLTKLARSFLVLTALVAAGLISTKASAKGFEDSGSVEMAYVKRYSQPIPDQAGHRLAFNEAEGDQRE